MSFLDTVDGLIQQGAQIYTSKEIAKNNADVVRADERLKVSGEFEERFFEERQVAAGEMAAQGQQLLKFGVIGLAGVTALVFIMKVAK